MLHPVQVMGSSITWLRRRLEPWAGDRPWALRLAGGVITLLVVGSSAGAGWILERPLLASLASVFPPFPHQEAPRSLPGFLPGLTASWHPWVHPSQGVVGFFAAALLVVALASALAGRSLEQAVQQVLRALPQTPQGDLTAARQRLAWIVGRDVEDLGVDEILRASAETASENAVDGLFAPLFWMLLGVLLWQIPGAPGPLSLAWAFKAASTLDSMLGYRRGSLRWLGTAGARLDDGLTWLPCRLVAFSLPLVSAEPRRFLSLGRLALRQGAPDPSPNAGVSQAIYALLLGVQLGGTSRYGGQVRHKPLVGVAGGAPISLASIQATLLLSRRLQGLWLISFGLVLLVSCITKILS